MSSLNVLKSLLLATSAVLGFCSLPAMAEQGGKCKTVTINFLVAPEATPALLEMLRRESGATESTTQTAFAWSSTKTTLCRAICAARADKRAQKRPVS